MYPTRLVLVISCVLIAAAPLYAGEFEGVIHMVMTRAGQSDGMKMDWYFKGEKARMEMARGEGQPWVSIVDHQTRKMSMPMPATRMYMEIPMDAPEEGVKEAMQQYTLERTGKTDKVAGHSCEIWLVKDKQAGTVRNETCVVKGFDNAAKFWGMESDRTKRKPAWVKAFQQEGAFGIRMIVRRENGTEEMRMEATNIERKKLDDTLFAVPAGYSKMEMPNIPGGAGTAGSQSKNQSEIQNIIREMQKNTAEHEPDANSGGAGGQPNVDEMMKRLGDMMKKQPPAGR